MGVEHGIEDVGEGIAVLAAKQLLTRVVVRSSSRGVQSDVGEIPSTVPS